MHILNFDLSKKCGAFKLLNAVNNGPCFNRFATQQKRSNFELYKAARIPFARNHDAAHFSGYGGEHAVDISAIFPNFDNDPYNEASYDFACTDEYVLKTLMAGTKTFYRLGQKIEHYIVKYNVHPPKNFKKWAVICEHIIRHYTQGWANGFEYDMPYWEIWNEADLGDASTWTGAKEQFFDLYETAAKHLKGCFPHLKIGGPALGWNEEWASEFLTEMKKREVPIDFFSWHIYRPEVKPIIDKSERIKKLLIDNGYENAESILNEWNYVKSWDADDFVQNSVVITGIKGACFTLAMMCASQNSTIDMLMYYDARPSTFNGLFDYYTFKPLKGYYPFLWYGMFYDMAYEIKCEDSYADIYTLCGVDKDGKTLSVVTYYTDKENEAEIKEIKVDFNKDAEYEIYLLDKDHDAELVKETSGLSFKIEPNSAILIKEK